MIMEPSAYRASRPAKRMGAGLLIRDETGRVLLVEPTYEQTWEIPGGAVEADESPRMACVREVSEELGLSVSVGRMLCIEWQGPEPDRTESIMLIYDGGVLPSTAELVLPKDELASFRFVALDELDQLLSQRIARRVRAAAEALAAGICAELEWGVAVGMNWPYIADVQEDSPNQS